MTRIIWAFYPVTVCLRPAGAALANLGDDVDACMRLHASLFLHQDDLLLFYQPPSRWISVRPVPLGGRVVS